MLAQGRGDYAIKFNGGLYVIANEVGMPLGRVAGSSVERKGKGRVGPYVMATRVGLLLKVAERLVERASS